MHLCSIEFDPIRGRGERKGSCDSTSCAFNSGWVCERRLALMS